jgi:ribosomal protein S14
MTLRSAGGHQTAETAEDLQHWLRRLEGCPPVTRTALARCTRPVHDDEPGTWFYVEADAAAGVARMRCLRCGDARAILDSTQRWTFPPAWACTNCSQSIAEVGFGVHEVEGVPSWLVVAVRCVECGDVQGVTDLVVASYAGDDILADL